MRILLYTSRFCPRCYMARKALRELLADRPGYELAEIDVLSSPRRAWRDGVRLVPAVRIGDRLLSGIYLSKSTIANFLDTHGNESSTSTA